MKGTVDHGPHQGTKIWSDQKRWSQSRPENQGSDLLQCENNFLCSLNLHIYDSKFISALAFDLLLLLVGIHQQKYNNGEKSGSLDLFCTQEVTLMADAGQLNNAV